MSGPCYGVVARQPQLALAAVGGETVRLAWIHSELPGEIVAVAFPLSQLV